MALVFLFKGLMEFTNLFNEAYYHDVVPDFLT